jgi:peroxiredoxin
MPEEAMADRPLSPGDRAPDFELPDAVAAGTLKLAEYLRRGPVLLAMLRGLYCPFCRRHISQLRPTCETLREAGITVLGVVVGSAARARRYFAHFPPCFPMAAAPDRAVHRAYGLPQVDRTPEFLQETEHKAAEILRQDAIPVPPGESADAVFLKADGFELTAEDETEWHRPLQWVGYFLIGRDGLVRWANVEARIVALPEIDKLLALV